MTFDVYCAGETLEGTSISMLHIEVTTPLGKIRLTEEEAELLGQLLQAAAKFNREQEASED